MIDLPADKFNIVFLVYLIQGIGCLLPWNFVITANQSKFINSFKNRKLRLKFLSIFYLVSQFNLHNQIIGQTKKTNQILLKYFETRLSDDNATISYVANFLPAIGIASKAPNIAFQALNFFVLTGFGSLAFRILSSIVIQIIMFVLLILLVLFNIEAMTFYWLTIAVVVGINMGNGVYQNCLYGSAALLPPRYINALIIGTNISGIFSSFLIILTIAIAPDATVSAFYYFLSAIIYLIICFITFALIIKNPFYIHYKKQQLTEDHLYLTAEHDEPEPINAKFIFECFRQIWQQCLNTFLVFFISLSLFPSVLVGVKQTSKIIPEAYFSAIACFLLFNVFAMIGNYGSEYLPKIPRKILWIPIVLRFVFVPLFLFSNYQAKNMTRKYAVFITNDFVFMFLVIAHGFTSGWFSSLSMMYAPKNVDPKYKSIAGMISSFCLIMGIMIGINSSIIWPKIMFN